MKKKLIAALLLAALSIALLGCAADAGQVSYPIEAYRTTMQYYEDFKILQLTDLHLGIETDMAKQLSVVTDAIRTEKPDLIILTGDSFMYASKGVVRNLIETLNTACREMTAEREGRLTKFTVTFGNHDNQGDYSRYFINEVLLSYATADGREVTDGKFAAFADFEDDDLFGFTNFYIDLVNDRAASRETTDVKYRLHIIDSNSYHFMGPDYDYDVIHEDQLSHVAEIYEGATADRDYIGLAFFHIPLYEYEEAMEQYKKATDPASLGQGEFNEGVLYGYENNGAYSALRAANVSAFFCGHDHINYCDLLYRAESKDASERAIFSYGVKTTNQLYHDQKMIGYKTVTLRDISAEEFLTVKNISENFHNVTGQGAIHYDYQ